MSTSDFATSIHEQRQRSERARLDALHKQKIELPDDARKALLVERIQKPEPIA